MYWESLLEEIKNKRIERSYSFSPFYVVNPKNRIKNQRRRAAMCKLGCKYPGIGFSMRESECILKILRGKTMAKTAEELGLSTRTVEFYLSNMRKKVNCKSKSQLIDVVLAQVY